MLPRDDRPDGAEKHRVDPDRFAEQVNYLAALGRLIVPRAFAFAGLRILFVGHNPFDAEELGGLLPDGTDWCEQQYAPDRFEPEVVVLGRTFPGGLIESVLEDTASSPKVIPQEGFLDELLFGHDWWTVKREALREMVGRQPPGTAGRQLDRSSAPRRYRDRRPTAGRAEGFPSARSLHPEQGDRDRRCSRRNR